MTWGTDLNSLGNSTSNDYFSLGNKFWKNNLSEILQIIGTIKCINMAN